MKLNKNEIEHIAELARLELTADELKLYGEQISDVLSYIDQLCEVDTSDVNITAQVTDLVSVMREDKVENWDNNERQFALERAQELENDQIKVKRVL